MPWVYYAHSHAPSNIELVVPGVYSAVVRVAVHLRRLTTQRIRLAAQITIAVAAAALVIVFVVIQITGSLRGAAIV